MTKQAVADPASRGQALTWAGEFADPAWELAYQEHSWPELSRLIRLSAMIGGIMFFAAGVVDYLAMGPGRAFLLCQAARLASLAVAMLPWAMARRPAYSPNISWAVLAMELGFGLTLALVVGHKTAGPGTMPSTMIIMVVVFYVIPPVRLAALTLGGVVVSALCLATLGLTNHGVDFKYILNTALLMVLVNMFGVLLVGRQNALRRRSFEQMRRLADAEGKYRLVVENAVEGIVVVDEERVLYVNPWVEHVTGLPRERLIGRPFTAVIDPDDRHSVAGSHARRMAESRAYGAKRFRVGAVDGRLAWVEATGVFVQWEGRPAALYFLSDITDRLLAEEQERLNQKVEAAIQTAGAACHELNQPLQTVLMQAELIMLALDDSHPLHGRMSRIIEAANQMARVTQRLNRITSFHTKVYIGREMILDLERSTAEQPAAGAPPAPPEAAT